MPAKKGSSNSNYPDVNKSTSRMVLDDIEVAPKEVTADEVLQALNERTQQRKNRPPVKQRCRKTLFVLAIVQAVILIPVCIFLAAHFATETNVNSFAFLFPAAVSGALLTLMLYRERGPGGMLEHSCAPVGCLGVTAVPQS